MQDSPVRRHPEGSRIVYGSIAARGQGEEGAMRYRTRVSGAVLSGVEAGKIPLVVEWTDGRTDTLLPSER
jgi:hypothetical protein